MQSTRTPRPYNVNVPRHWAASGIYSLTFLVALAALIPEAGAQQDIAAPSGEPRYTVELIVFAYRTEDSGGNEIFVPEKPALVPDAEEELPADVAQNTFGDIPEELPDELPPPDAGAEAQAEDDANPESRRIELHLLESEKYSMDDVYRKLQQLDAYQPIMHTAWTQTTPPKDASPAVHLRALGEPPPGLDGSVTLYRGRYLHLIVDLALDASGAAHRENMTATDRLIAYGDGRAHDDEGRGGIDPMLGQPVRYRILEDRIMKTGDLRYFDHPRFGVIARVTAPEDESAAAGAALP